MATKHLITKGHMVFIRIIPTIIFLVLLYYLINYIKNNYNSTENFTPKMRQMYRPYLRNARIVSEGFYGDSKNSVNTLFRKLGLY